MDGVVPIGALVRYLRDWLAANESFSDVWAVGEVSNYSRSAAGHQYFTLRDDESGLRAVLFRGDDRRVPVANGDRIFVHGRVDIYLPRGELQFKCDFLRPEGVGILAAQFEELKERLDREGLFDLARKRTLPPFPHKIGVVTSPTGAAIQDIRNVLSHRWPLAELILSPAVVQGDQAPASIVRAIERIAHEPDLDVLIVARGGGSSEDLAAFNDEAVARAVFGFPVPVVAGVGHETDTSIVDHVADLRAATPSAAAERATPSIQDIRLHALRNERVMGQQARRLLQDSREDVAMRVSDIRRRLPDPARLGADCERTVTAIATAVRHCLRHARQQATTTDHRLRTLSPLATLDRGYAIVHQAEKRKVVQSTRQVKPGMRLVVSVKDGAFATEVS